MARRKRSKAPYQLEQDPRNGIWTLRFTSDGRQHRVSTRTTDFETASQLAPEIYKQRVGRSPKRKALDVICAEYLAAREGQISPADWNRAQYSFKELVLPHFGNDPEAITPELVESYIEKRLKKVSGATVDKELTPLRAALRRANRVGDLEAVPRIRKANKDRGTDNRPRDRVDVSAEQAEAVIEALPEVTKFGNRPRDAFILVWELGLRWETVERLEVPRHFKPGRHTLRITSDIDKNGWERELPLTERAVEALERSAPKRGPIFGKYGYRRVLRTAAKSTGLFSPAEVEELDARDFRHACGNHLAETGTSLAGIAYLMGHKDESTTARLYLHPGKSAAIAALTSRFGSVKSPETKTKGGDKRHEETKSLQNTA